MLAAGASGCGTPPNSYGSASGYLPGDSMNRACSDGFRPSDGRSCSYWNGDPQLCIDALYGGGGFCLRANVRASVPDVRLAGAWMSAPAAASAW